MTRWTIHLDKLFSTSLARSVAGRWLSALHQVLAGVDSSVLWSTAALVAALAAAAIQVTSEAFVQLVDKDAPRAPSLSKDVQP